MVLSVPFLTVACQLAVLVAVVAVFDTFVPAAVRIDRDRYQAAVRRHGFAMASRSA